MYHSTERKLTTPLLKAGDSGLTVRVGCTAEGAIQTDLEGKQLNNSRVDANRQMIQLNRMVVTLKFFI